MKYYIALILLLSVKAVAGQATVYSCQDATKVQDLVDKNGILNISREHHDCGFMSAANVQLFVIKTNELRLGDDDNIELSEAEAIKPDPERINPPFDAGYIISGIKRPRVIFNFNKTDDRVMKVEYWQGVNQLTFNADVNNANNFKITPLNVTEFNLVFNKSITDYVHVEVSGANIRGTKLKHFLIKDETQTITLEFLGDQKVEVKTSIADRSCSNKFDEKQENSREIIGPSGNNSRNGYKCVNIFKTSLENQAAHFEANFENFIDFTDLDDKLTLDDSSENRVDILKSQANSYRNQVLSFSGKELAVIYDSPRAVKPSVIQLRLTVASKADGGIIKQQGPLNLPAQGQVRYVLVPQAEQYAAIEFKEGKLLDANVTILEGDKLVAKFTANTRLPPLVVSNERNVRMTLKISGNNFNKLAKSVTFKSLVSSCHKITSGNSDYFSVSGGQDPCYWTLASTENVGLIVNYNDLPPNGCLTIQPLNLEKPIYNKCNLTRLDIIPTFALRQAVITLALPSNNSRFEATLSRSSKAALNYLDTTQVVSSQGYPVSYVWSSETQSYLINSAKQNHLVTFADVDIRAGEKLLLNGVTVDTKNGDMILSNVSTTNVTVARSPATSDFNIHRGFKLSIKQFDSIISADLSRKNLTTPKNLTSLLVKISSPSSVVGKFGKRILFKVSSANQTFNMSLHDGRSLTAHTLNSTTNSSTSDTLLLNLKVDKPQIFLPQLIIEYGTLDCNTTFDHICDANTRCVPHDKLCKGIFYCDDGSDMKYLCGSEPVPPAQVIESGVAGITVFILCVLMLTLGAVSALYGPDLFKTLENRFRSGQYTTFTSTD